ncbi:MAG: glycoside hydrolase family 43 protein [Telluria sp.]
MHAKVTLRACALAAALLAAGCGGGGGGSSTPPPAATPQVPTNVETTLAFIEASVHDPAVIKDGDTYYLFGSHLAAARSTDLMNWTKVADGVDNANPLFANVTTALADAFAWSQVNSLWAADVIEIDGKFYFYYNTCKGDSPRSAMGLAVADEVEGPYVNKGVFLKSGMWDQASPDGKMYDARIHPNAVDPHTFRDKEGKLWMIYGSYSGGIFIMEMDKATGMPLAGQGYGKHLMGGNHARIEGAYVMYSRQSDFYYLFTSFGGLDAGGAYNMRVARSRSSSGPYVDARGTDMASVKANPALPLFDDASIAPHGQKLFGNHQFAAGAGEAGVASGYVSAGHNSARYEAATQQYFLFFHARFPGRGEQHEIRVHEMFINEDGWPVVAPLRYAPLSKSAVALTAQVSAADAQGSYQFINHGKDISVATRTAQAIRLESGGAVSGAVSGSWTHRGANKVQLVLAGGTVFSGVLSRQFNANARRFVVTLTAQAADGVSVWGVRTGT